MSQSILPAASSDGVLHIRWSLLNSCLYSCSYCASSREDGDCVILRERLMRMAWRILQKPARLYDITLTGGEPALHPYLPELIAYFLNVSRKLRLTLETNGIQDIAWHLNLLGGRNELAFAISVHPAFADAGHICSLAASLADAGAPVRINLFYDPAALAKTEMFRTLLIKLGKAVNFEFEITAPAEACAWREIALAEWAQGGVKAPKLVMLQDEGAKRDISDSGPVWCVHGANAVFIEPTGRIAGAACANICMEPHLWRQQGRIDAALAIRQCDAHGACQELNCFLPKFPSREEACAWLEQRRRLEADLQNGLVILPDPVTGESSPEQSFRSRLARLARPQANGMAGRKGSKRKLKPHPQLLASPASPHLRIYAALADAVSRDLYLRAIKALQTGDAAWLACEDRQEDKQAELPQNSPLPRLELRKPLMPAEVSRLEGELRRRKPTVCARLALTGKSIVDALGALLQAVPDYQLYLRMDVARELRIAAMAQAGAQLAMPLDAPERPFLSVIILAGGEEKALMRSVDSALLQGPENIEIIIADGGSPEAAGRRIDEYAFRYPKIVRLYRPGGKDNLLNAALSLARGQYLAFAPCGDMLASDFLAMSKECAAKSCADIIGFEIALAQEGKEDQIWGVSSGEFQGGEALKGFARQDFGPYGLGGRLYRREFLRAEAVRFAEMAAYADLAFSLLAFYYAARAVILPDIGYYHYGPAQYGPGAQLEDGEFLAAFTGIAAYLNDFFTGLDLASHAACAVNVYAPARERLCGLLVKASGDELAKTAAAIAQSRPMLDLVLRDYAMLACHVKGEQLKVAEEDRDWRKAAGEADAEIAWHAYGDADGPVGKAPRLSVVLPNYNKADYLEACLQSILTQSFRDFELIAIDDASDDGSWEMLQDYADGDARIRLYRLENNCRQGICRNLCMDKARGRWLIFVDSDDIVECGFFAHAVKSAEREAADAVFFSLRVVKDGKEEWRKELKPRIAGNAELLRMYWDGTFTPAPYAKIFSAAFLRISGARFAPYIYHQDQFFIGQFCSKARRVALDPFMAYSMTQSANSSVRPATRKYLHVRSCLEFYEFLGALAEQTEAEEEGARKHVIWNLENIFLKALAAFMNIAGELPLTEADYALLQKNDLFGKALCAGFAVLLQKGDYPQGMLAEAPLRRFADAPDAAWLRPLVSVIVPVYNQDKLLGRALNSILHQSLRNLEVIVIDDASTDHTAAVCAEYAKRDGRVRFLQNECNSGGVGKPREIGINRARGKCLTFVDSDDYIFDFLQHGMAQLINKPDVDFIQFARIEKEGSKEIIHRDFKYNTEFVNYSFFDRYMEGGLSCWNAVAKIFKISFLRDKHFYMPDFLFEDNIFLIQVYEQANAVIYDPMLAYAQIRVPHAASAMRPLSYTKRHIRGYFACAAWISRFMRSNPEIGLKYKNVLELRVKQRNQYPKVLEYLGAFKGQEINPLTEEDEHNLVSSPELCKMILEDFAELWAKENSQENLVMGMAEIKTSPITIECIKDSCLDTGIDISIIIPAYNVSRKIKRCIESALQTNHYHAEIIIIDDGSTDDTLKICTQYAINNATVRLYKMPYNSGPGSARNQGVALSRGKYITFLDSDDIFYPNFLERGIGFVSASQCEMASFTIGNQLDQESIWYCKPNGDVAPERGCKEHMLGKYKHWAAWGRIYLADFLKRNNILFSDLIYEDVPFMLEAYAKSKKHVYADIYSVLSVRNRNESIMHNAAASKLLFMSELYNLQKIFQIFSDSPAINTDEMYKRYLMWQFEPKHIFWKDFLGYIYCCRRDKLPSPLTEDVLARLLALPGFMSLLLRKYAEMHSAGLSRGGGNG